jgi:hypothetical protein
LNSFMNLKTAKVIRLNIREPFSLAR